MYRPYRLDLHKALSLKRQGLSNTQIAQRLGFSRAAVYLVLKKTKDVADLNKTVAAKHKIL